MFTRCLPSLLTVVIAGFASAAYSRAADDALPWCSDSCPAQEVFYMAQVPELQQDLALSLEQITKLVALQQTFQEQFKKIADGIVNQTLTESESDKLQFATEDEHRQKILATLTAAQRARLRQIALQFHVLPNMFRDAGVKQELKLTEPQKAAVLQLVEAFNQERHELQKLELKRDARKERTCAAAARRDELALALLTEDQRATWSNLTGVAIDTVSLRPKLDLRTPAPTRGGRRSRPK
jgi:hypothetical protein